MRKIIPIIIVLVVVGGGAFYGGMKYSQSTSQNFAWQNLGGQDSSPGQRGQFSQERPQGRNGANFINGEVISKDDQSLTIKMPDGGSKIIFFSDSTEISKRTDGSVNDIEIGKQVMVSGEQNSDGSYTAKTIQITEKIN